MLHAFYTLECYSYVSNTEKTRVIKKEKQNSTSWQKLCLDFETLDAEMTYTSIMPVGNKDCVYSTAWMGKHYVKPEIDKVFGMRSAQESLSAACGYGLRIDTHYGYWLMETAQLKSLQIDLCALRMRTTDTHYGYALRTYGKAPLHTSLCIRIRLSKYNCTVLYCRLTWKSLSLMFAFSFWGHFPWLLSGVSPHRWAPGCRKHWGREHVHVLSLLRPA